jgi:hypothetical protein
MGHKRHATLTRATKHDGRTGYVSFEPCFERFEDLEFTSVVYGRQTRDGSVQFTVDAIRR